MKIRRPLHHRLDKGAKLVGIAVGCVAVFVTFARQHLKLEIEIPADQHQLLPRPEENLAQDPEIIRRIDDKAEPIGPGDAPCGLVIEQALAVRPLGRRRVVRLSQFQIALHVFAPFHSMLQD